MSSHNRGYLPHVHGPLQVRTTDPLRLGRDLVYAPLRWSRHRRLRALELRTDEYAIVSDGSHDFTLLHYYIDPAGQRRQLEQEGFELLEVRDLDGNPVEEDDGAESSSELHYAARRR
jgi:hypothetical protein